MPLNRRKHGVYLMNNFQRFSNFQFAQHLPPRMMPRSLDFNTVTLDCRKSRAYQITHMEIIIPEVTIPRGENSGNPSPKQGQS